MPTISSSPAARTLEIAVESTAAFTPSAASDWSVSDLLSHEGHAVGYLVKFSDLEGKASEFFLAEPVSGFVSHDEAARFTIDAPLPA